MPFRSRATRALFATAGLLLAGSYALALLAPATGTYHDDAIYLVTAKALAEGSGYRLISLPGEPFQTKYPVLFPWMVSLLWRLYPSFPDNLPWLRLAGLASLGAWLTASWHLCRRLGASREAAWVTMLLLGASPWVLFLSTTFMAEIPYGACVVAGMFVLTRIHDGDSKKYDGWLAGLLMGASILMRVAGVATTFGGFVALVAARRWMQSAQFAAAAITVVLPWAWWVAWHNAALATIDTYYSANPYGSWNIVTNYAMSEKARVLAFNAVHSGLSAAAFWDIQPPVWLGFIVTLLFFAVIGRGFWITRRHPVTLVTGLYFAVVLCWVWPPLRLLVPLAPGIGWLVVAGTPRPRIVASVLALTVGLACALQFPGQILERLEKQTALPVSTQADSWPSTVPLLNWIARETPEDTILTGNLDPMYFLYTGRKAIRAFSADAYALYYTREPSRHPLGTVDDFRRRLLTTGASYLILTPNAGFGEMSYLRAHVAELIAARSGALTVAAGSVGTGYIVYRISRDRLGPPVAAD